jgi:hypothetical protein
VGPPWPGREPVDIIEGALILGPEQSLLYTLLVHLLTYITSHNIITTGWFETYLVFNHFVNLEKSFLKCVL